MMRDRDFIGSRRNLELIRTEDIHKKSRGYIALYDVINMAPLSSDPYRSYVHVLRDIRERYTNRDIEQFYSDIKSGANIYHPTGKFISAAINAKMNEGDTIVLKNPEIRLDHIGDHLCYGITVIVDGGVGDWAGQFNDGGLMIIRGGGGKEIAHNMFDGEIISFGHVGENAGHRIQNGRLIILGDAEENLGNGSKPEAEIVVTGLYAISQSCKAKVVTDITKLTNRKFRT
jgi:formylmethanofuran dehydrogenase subunit C